MSEWAERWKRETKKKSLLWRELWDMGITLAERLFEDVEDIECEAERCPLWRRGQGCIASKCIKKVRRREMR